MTQIECIFFVSSYFLSHFEGHYVGIVKTNGVYGTVKALSNIWDLKSLVTSNNHFDMA